MTNTWFISDTHFGHANIIKFTDKDGQRIRPFASIEEHDETIIENVNKVVKPNDRLYMMGDVVINRKALPTVAKLNGRKKLIKGNHDIFRLDDYAPYFDDIVAYRIYQDAGLIVSHIPVHTSQLEHRFKFNLHGHLHQHLIQGDLRYINGCLEHTNFGPLSFDQVKVEMEERKLSVDYDLNEANLTEIAANYFAGFRKASFNLGSIKLVDKEEGKE